MAYLGYRKGEAGGGIAVTYYVVMPTCSGATGYIREKQKGKPKVGPIASVNTYCIRKYVNTPLERKDFCGK